MISFKINKKVEINLILLLYGEAISFASKWQVHFKKRLTNDSNYINDTIVCNILSFLFYLNFFILL